MVFSPEKITPAHRIGVGLSPNEADIAVVSIDAFGNSGRLNMFVLEHYGYSEKDLPSREALKHGFSQIPESDGKKALLFVVTVNEGNTAENLEKNLYNTLIEFRGWYAGRKIWIPLMGTGDGGLSVEESYEITARVINRSYQNYPVNADFIISLPSDEDGVRLFNLLEGTSEGDIKKEAEEFVAELKCNFFLAGSSWGKNNDQTERFTKDSIWEKGFEDDSYSDTINKIKEGDILIIKSTYAQNGVSYLKVKALGIVTHNPQDGTLLNVDWRITGLWIDVEDLGFYRNTISMATVADVVTIFTNIQKGLWQRMLPAGITSTTSSTATATSNKIPVLISDSDKGLDYLDISKDVKAFARVVAAKSFEPPIAIALFGKWGSGKSFFMRKLREQVDKLSERSKDEFYCKGVVHIHFNAWSYVDANLWASIVSKIFEGLKDYISINGKETEKAEIEKQLAGKLVIAQESIGILESQKETLTQQISSLEKKKEKANQDLKEALLKIENKTLSSLIENAGTQFDVKNRIKKALEENSSYRITEAELKQIVPEKYWSDPHASFDKLKSKYTFLKQFFRADKVKNNLCFLIVILLAIFFIPILLELLKVKISQFNFLIPQAGLSLLFTVGAAWKRGETVYKELQPIVASFWGIKVDYEKKMEETKAKFEQEEKVIKLEIEKSKSEVLFIEGQIRKVTAEKTELEYRIGHALATETLYSFIDKRSKSEDYKKHLGIISIIRRDFEVLSDLFTDHNIEVAKAEDAESFRSKFNKPLERIILYIDDLDRCPEENVVQVMDAVNLLMAFPLFVVIVGVDSRWIRNALIKKHALQFDSFLNGHDRSQTEREMIEPSNYLEKIFQVPFHLKDASPEKVKDMIRQLASAKPKTVSVYRNERPSEETTQEEKAKLDKESQIPQIPATGIDNTPTVQSPSQTVDLERPELLELTEEEIKVMEDLAEVIGNNPRAIKRFINIYRVIKAHEDFVILTTDAPQQLPAILFLLALPLGDYRKLLPTFETYIDDDTNAHKPISMYLQTSNRIIPAELDKQKNKLDVILSVKETFNTIQRTPASIYAQHNKFIKRFTFKNI